MPEVPLELALVLHVDAVGASRALACPVFVLPALLEDPEEEAVSEQELEVQVASVDELLH